MDKLMYERMDERTDIVSAKDSYCIQVSPSKKLKTKYLITELKGKALETTWL